MSIVAALGALRSQLSRWRAPLVANARFAAPNNTSWPRPLSSTSAAGEESPEEVRSRIFGTRIGTGQRSGAKILRRKLVGEKVASYYPDPIARLDPRYVSLRAEAKKAKLEKLKRRGKGPPPKGQGKRSSSGKRK